MHGGVFDRKKWPDQIGLENLPPIVFGLLEEGNEAAADPGIGVDNVERTERRKRAIDKSLDVFLAARIRGERMRGAAALRYGARCLVQPLRVQIDDQQTGAFAREQN